MADYLCKDWNGNYFVASRALAAALDREDIHRPVNLPWAMSVPVAPHEMDVADHGAIARCLVGTRWETAAGANRWLVAQARGYKVQVVNERTGDSYWWHIASILSVADCRLYGRTED